MKVQNPYLTLGEIAALAGVHKNSVRFWCLTGKLPYIKIGRTFAVRREEALRFLNNRHAIMLTGGPLDENPNES